ncbi:MAG: response regulator [Candidatus Geothermincolia bacterium]
MKKILIIEDEVPLAEALKYTLGKEGYAADLVHDGAEGFARFSREGFDLVLLDIMLPTMDGLEVCRRIRAASAVPVIMLTAKDSDVDEILGLEIGADDYVTKPFNMRTLIARIRTVLRRAGEERAGARKTAVVTFEEIVMDREKHEVIVRGDPVQLTPTEYGLLEAMIQRPGKVVSRERLLTAVWGDFYGSSKTLDVHIRHLREKVERDPGRPEYVMTVRGVGYKLSASGGQKART